MTAHALSLIGEEAWVSMPIQARILAAATWFMGGGRYGGASCPFPLPSNFANLRKGKSTVCSPFTAALLAAAYPRARWNRGHWADLQIYDGANLDSPIETLTSLGIGTRTERLLTGRAHLAQGWVTTSPPKGHSFFVLAQGDGEEAILQSSSIRDVGPTLDVKPSGWAADRYPTLYLSALR